MVAPKKMRARGPLRTLPVQDVTGEQLAWLLEWTISRVYAHNHRRASNAKATASSRQVDAGLVEVLRLAREVDRDLVVQQTASGIEVKRLDIFLAMSRAPLARAFEDERRHKREPLATRSARRAQALHPALKPLTAEQWETIAEFDLGSGSRMGDPDFVGSDRAATSLLQRLFARSKRVQDEARAFMNKKDEAGDEPAWRDEVGYPRPRAHESDLLRTFLDHVVECDGRCTDEIVELYLSCLEFGGPPPPPMRGRKRSP